MAEDDGKLAKIMEEKYPQFWGRLREACMSVQALLRSHHAVVSLPDGDEDGSFRTYACLYLVAANTSAKEGDNHPEDVHEDVERMVAALVHWLKEREAKA